MTAEWGVRAVGDDDSLIEVRKSEIDARCAAERFDREAESVDDPTRHEVVRRQWVAS